MPINTLFKQLPSIRQNTSHGRFAIIRRVVGGVLALSSVVSVPSMLISWYTNDGHLEAFVTAFAISAGLGALFWASAGKVGDSIRLRDGFLITALCWFTVCLSASIPFMLAPPNLSFIDAIFEATSGITTTGATLIVGLDELPKSVLFYRQFLHFIGGMGIVILAVAILPMLGIGGLQLFRAEISGAVRDTKLMPRVTETAKVLWLIYVSLTALCALAYWAGGMTLFDALGHAFSTLATAGFSTHDASIGYYNSTLIETIAIVFMCIGALNYSLHFVAWRRASMAPYIGDVEAKVFFRLIIFAAIVCTFGLYLHGTYPTFLESFRHGLFQVVASTTTTGFGTASFYLWPGALPLIVILLSFSGGCAGSTTGGMKVRRVAVLLRMGLRELRQLVHPKAEFVVRAGGMPVSDQAMRAVAGFFALYIACFAVFSIALASMGTDLLTSVSAAAACLNNLGPALGLTGPHFAHLNDPSTLLLSLAMIVGRLEVFTLLVLFTPTFWRE